MQSKGKLTSDALGKMENILRAELQVYYMSP
jgi:hypothetical protein